MGVGTAREEASMMDTAVRCDIEAERALLGMLLAGAEIGEAAKVVERGAFWHERHMWVYDAITAVAESGRPVTIQSVDQQLARMGTDRRLLDPLFLTELYGAAPMVGDAAWYAQRITDEAAFRAIGQAGSKLQAVAANPALEIAEAREIARAAVDDATADSERRAHVRVSDVLPDVIDQADKGTNPALSTPWPDIDRLIGGLAPGRLVVVGARPGVGKSLMGTNLALHFADHHKHAVLIASLEMDRNEVVQRILAAKARVDLGRLLESTLTDQEWDSIAAHSDALIAMPLTIDDSAVQTVSSIRAAARDIQRERDDLSVIVVDYLQLMAAPEVSAKANRSEAVGAVSRGLKILARETGTCVVAMAQVNREGIKNGRPTMADLRESGAIEADANQVILLHRPDDDLPDIEVIVDKNRHGPKGQATLKMQGHYAKLANVAWSPSGRADG